MKTLEICDLSFSYENASEENTIFNNCDLTIEDSRIIGLVGVNGSGKSTLLKIIKGDLLAQTGSVMICGERTSEMGSVSFMTQQTIDNVFPKLTVFENYMLFHERRPFSLLRYDKDCYRQKCKERLQVAEMGLETRLDEQVRFLSGGQQQALCIILACDASSPVLLMDEPTASLDVFVAEKVLKLATKEIFDNNGFLMLTSHNLYDIIKYTDTIVVLNKGGKTTVLNNADHQLDIDYLRKSMLSINPWKFVTPEDYEGHMHFLGQDVLLNSIFKEQVSDSSYNTIGIIGIGCGNGLEYIHPDAVVYGYDINEFFLETTRSRYSTSFKQLILKEVDLNYEEPRINSCDLLICNLVLELISLSCFINLIKNALPTKVSIVLQLADESENAISKSPFSSHFENLSSIWSSILPEDLISALYDIDYLNTFVQKYYINQGRSFLRLDFSRGSI